MRKMVRTMGSPNDQTNNDLLKVIRDVAYGRVNESLLRKTGVDLIFLNATFDRFIKHNLDSMYGFEEFKDVPDPQGNRGMFWDPIEKVQRPVESWKAAIERAKIPRNQNRVVEILSCSLVEVVKTSPGERVHRRPMAAMKLYLTRRGKWILHSYDQREDTKRPFSNDELSIHGSIDDLWAEIERRSLDGYSIGYAQGKRADYLPLEIEARLRELLRASIRHHSSLVDSMKLGLEFATESANIVTHS